MKFEWIKCEDRLPEMPKRPLEQKEYLVTWKCGSRYLYQILGWADGWNCSINPDGTIYRKSEIKNIVAWAEIPKYED